MAKTLTHQVRLWPASGDDSSTGMFGDGNPLHSAIGFDFYQNVNNLQTYVEPCFQFAFDAGGSSHQVKWTKASDKAGNGEIFLGQLPLIIPHDAVRLCWTIGLRRRPVGETSISVDVTGLHFFLAPNPCQAIDDDLLIDRTRFTFYAERSITLTETGAGSGNLQGVYKMIDDTNPGWTDAIPAIPGIQEMTETPIVWGVFTADIANGVTTGEDVELEEFSLWGAYE